MSAENDRSLLDSLTLKRMGDEEPAGLWIASLPLPRNTSLDLSLSGATTWKQGLGQWYDVPSPSPRRALLVADADGLAPERLDLTRHAQTPTHTPPEAVVARFAESPDKFF